MLSVYVASVRQYIQHDDNIIVGRAMCHIIRMLRILLCILPASLLLTACKGNSPTPGKVSEYPIVVERPADDVLQADPQHAGIELREESAIDNVELVKEELTSEGIEPVENELTAKGGEMFEKEFYITEITDEIFNRIYGLSYKENCTVSRDDLRYLHLLHKDLDGNTLSGEMICNKAIADDVLDIFRQLYESDYPIERIELVDKYNADDELSMEANNSSSFNYRNISYSSTLSKHSYGLAVDINTLYNPYVKTVNGKTSVEPVTATEYVDRGNDFPYKIDHDDLAFRLFTEKGFIWGGDWTNSKDYQHFEVTDEMRDELYP